MRRVRQQRDPNWTAIKAWYETSPRGLQACAMANGSTVATIKKRAMRLGWTRCAEADRNQGRLLARKPRPLPPADAAVATPEDDIGALPPLNDYEARFVDEYMVDHNGGLAIQRAGFVPRPGSESDPDTLAATAATKMKMRAAVQAHIAYRQALLARRCGFDAERVKRELGAIAFSDPLDFYRRDPATNALAVLPIDKMTREARAAIAEVILTTDKNGNQVTRLKLHNKTHALEKLGQTLDLFRQTHVVRDERDEGDRVGDSVAQRLAAIRAVRANGTGANPAIPGDPARDQGGPALPQDRGAKTVH